MNDEPLQSLLDTWYRDREVPRPEVQTGVGRVMADVPQTRQRSRWWPFPIFYRRTQSPTATDLTDTVKNQPSHIPASNGHNPTVIGRTSSMLSPVKAITAGALVFAIGGVLLIAQPFDQRGASVPGAVTDDEAAPNTEFTAEWGFTSGGCCVVVEPASDPRFAGAMSASISHAYHPFPDFLLDVASRALHVVNDEGAWRGVPSVVVFHPDGTESTTTQTFIGEGDYAGSYAVADIKSTPGAGGGVELHGYIIEGEPPAVE